MECDTPFDESCIAWLGASSIIPMADPKPYTQFYVELHVRFTYPPSDFMDDDDDSEDDDDIDRLESEERCMQFWVPCDGLTCQNNNTWSTISDMLRDLGVPLRVQPFMISRIIPSAELLVKQNQNLMVLPMVVSMDVVGSPEDNDDDDDDDDVVVGRQEEEEEEEEDDDDAMVPMEWRRVPASEASVEALEKLKVENSDSKMMQCVICMEQLLVGSEATRMPCLHDFHGDCLVRWLGVSNLCPLCRFRMPT
ncbi:E3 ubiquitin-protein ligase CIP8-like [Cornus florida]|uniref:E3 ubiquitin-protein ligase CIP8-like n=1 Tax=Cornus florida TaxID=4283 RepID=UPI0028A0A104|nr:E3 ubiquitin-protein ligase CIP8-like [Cornus florida]